MFGRLGPLEIIIIFAIVLLILGPQRLAGAAKALGRSIAEFRRASKDPDSPEGGASK